MKKYVYFWFAIVALVILGTITQPENYVVFEEHKAKLVQLFGLFGVIVALPMSYLLYKQSSEESQFKKIWNTSLASAALFIVSFLVFAIAGEGLSGHVINFAQGEKIALHGSYTFPSDDGHFRVRSRKAAVFGVAIAAVMGVSGKSIVFNGEEDKDVYSLKVDTKMASNKLAYPDNMKFPDTDSIFQYKNNAEKATLIGRKTRWGLIFDEIQMDS